MKARMYAMAALAGMMTLAGCNNQDEPGTGNRPLQGTPIRVTTQVTEPETRTEMTKEDLTEFYFRVTEENGATGIYNHFTKMTLGNGGEWVAESGETTWGDVTAQVSAVAQKTTDGNRLQWT